MLIKIKYKIEELIDIEDDIERGKRAEKKVGPLRRELLRLIEIYHKS